MNRIDVAGESLTRWTAARTTRRSFIHRLGQLAMFVAAGPTIAGLLMRKAEARVCGQSGVTPKCDTFDCNGIDDVWGWCWYASDGCCRNDGLKKICDCCTVNYPNVHGYCPSGSNVRCIVESCGNDPRLLTVALTGLSWAAGSGYAASAAVAAEPRSTRVVVTSADQVWATAIAAPLAGVLGSPVLPFIDSASTVAGDPNAANLEAIARLGAETVMVVGPLDPSIVAQLRSLGLDVELVAPVADPGQISRIVAGRIIEINDINRTVTVAETGLSASALPLAASFAALNGYPLIVGSVMTAVVGLPTVYVGPEPADAGVTSERTTSTDLSSLSIELAELAAAAPFSDPSRVALAPAGSADLLGLVNTQAPIVLHPPGQLGPVAPWLQTHALRFGALSQVFYVTGPGALETPAYWELQGTVNGFRIDQLTGQPGEGLPVTRQPYAERPIGKARIDGAFEWGTEPTPSYWTSVAQTYRR